MEILKMKPSDKGLLKVLKYDIKQSLSKESIASLFWKSMLYVLFIGIAIFDYEIAQGISAVCSLFLLAVMIDGDEDGNVFWFPLTFLFWICLLVVIVCFSMYHIIKIINKFIVKPFNNWLNSFGRKDESKK